MQLGIASDSPMCSSTSSAASWIRLTPLSSRGRYRPPIMPGRTAFSSSRSGAARSLCLAVLPPMRRPLTAADSLMAPSPVAWPSIVRVIGHANIVTAHREHCREQFAIFRGGDVTRPPLPAGRPQPRLRRRTKVERSRRHAIVHGALGNGTSPRSGVHFAPKPGLLRIDTLGRS